MTIEDLREHGVLLPEEEWGKADLETTARETPLLLTFLVAGGALAAAFAGDGGTLTWIGTGVFLVCLYAITWMCDRAVLRQRRRVADRRGAKGAGQGLRKADDDGAADDEGDSDGRTGGGGRRG